MFSILPPKGVNYIVEFDKAVHVYVPANFYASLLVRNYKPEFSTYKDEPWRHIDKLAYFVSLIPYYPAVNKKLDLEETDGFVPLHSKVLRKVLGKNSHEYISFLQDIGVIEVESSYSAGNHSMGYRLTDEYRFSELKGYPIRLKRLAESILKHRYSLHSEASEYNSIQVDDSIWQQQDFVKNAEILKELSHKVSIDAEAAEAYINPMSAIPKPVDPCKRRKKKRRKSRSTVAGKRRKPTKRQQKKAKDYTAIDKANAYRVNVLMLNRKNSGYAFQNRTSGRFFTPLVSLKSELRSFVSIDGYSDLREVDLKNSQPMLLASLLRDWDDIHPMVKETLKWVNPKAFQRVEENCRKISEEKEQEEIQEYQWERQEKIKESAERISLLMLCKKELFDEKNEPIWDIINVHDEFATFRSLVLSGRIYEFLMELAKVFGFEEITRSTAKCMFLRMMYGQTRYLGSLPLYKVFERIFPNLCDLFALIKEDDKTDFPIFLQLLEARIFLGKALTKIWDQDGSIPLQTIHDSFLLPEQYALIAKTVLAEVVEEIVGLPPSIRVSNPKDKLAELEAELEELNIESPSLSSSDDCTTQSEKKTDLESTNTIIPVEELDNFDLIDEDISDDLNTEELGEIIDLDD